MLHSFTSLPSFTINSQATLPRFRRQDSLPKIEPSARGSVDLASIPSKGHTLGPGLDFAFREAPTTFGIDAAAHSISGAGKVTSTDGGNPSRAGSVEEGSTDHCRSGLKRHPSDEVGVEHTTLKYHVHPGVDRTKFLSEFQLK